MKDSFLYKNDNFSGMPDFTRMNDVVKPFGFTTIEQISFNDFSYRSSYRPGETREKTNANFKTPADLGGIELSSWVESYPSTSGTMEHSIVKTEESLLLIVTVRNG